MLRLNRLGMTALVWALVAVPCMAETFEEVEKKLLEAIKKTKSFKADMKVEVNVAVQGFEMKNVTVGTMEAMHEGDKFLLRTEGVTNSTRKVAGTESKTQQKLLTISDGKFSYTVTETGGVKSVLKNKASVAEDMPWKSHRKDAKFKVLPDEKIDGADCYVIEALIANTTPGVGMGRMVYYCRKDCGIQAKTVGYTPEGKVMMTATISNIVLNKSIPASRFVFKAPDGVTITDMTGG